MVQPTLEHYFYLVRPPKAAPKITFLDLPFVVRRRIYLIAGLLSGSTICLNYIPSSGDHCDLEYYAGNLEQWPKEESLTARSSSLTHFLNGYLPWPQVHLNRHCLCLEQQTPIQLPCTCHPLPYQLLYVSRVIAKEVSTIFYSENHFSVYWTGLGGLSSLYCLPPGSLAHLKSLSVILNFYSEDDRWGYDFGPDTGSMYHWMCRSPKLPRLLSSAKGSYNSTVLKEWQLLCNLLESQYRPNYLKLFLTCDVADVEVAQKFIRPLLQLSNLRECAVRLGSYYVNTEIHSLALAEISRRTVDTATNHSAERRFRFLDLPNEVQLQILEETELVTPFDLVWGSNTDVARRCRSPYYEKRTFYLDFLWSWSCCQKCSPNPQPCACWSGQIAFSTSCTCWRFPISLFLVNHAIRENAEYIFYSRNRFVLLSESWQTSGCLEIYKFLQHVPANGRRYLRNITWLLSSLQKGDGFLEAAHFTHTQWLAAMRILKNELPPGQLSLTIDPRFDIQSVLYGYGSDYIDLPSDCGIAEAEHVRSVCERLMDFLVKDVHLKSLHIPFVWPFDR